MVAHRDQIQEGIVRFLAETRLSKATDPQGREWLSISGHSNGAIQAQPRHRMWAGRRSANSEFYEEATTLVMSYLLGQLRPTTFLDVGAWKGYFSLLAASHLASRPTAYAFDMRPSGIASINEKVQGLSLPGRVEGRLVGFSDRHVGSTKIWYSRMKMFEREPEPSEYREAPWRRLKFLLKGNKERGLQTVDLLVTSLDQYCTDHGLVPQLIKIDVDGYEGKVLRGARDLLTRVRPTIFLELHKDEVQRDGILRDQVVGMLFDAGYSALFLTDHHKRDRCKIVPVESGDPLLKRQQTDMIVFLPPAQ